MINMQAQVAPYCGFFFYSLWRDVELSQIHVYIKEQQSDDPALILSLNSH